MYLIEKGNLTFDGEDMKCFSRKISWMFYKKIYLQVGDKHLMPQQTPSLIDDQQMKEEGFLREKVTTSTSL